MLVKRCERRWWVIFSAPCGLPASHYENMAHMALAQASARVCCNQRRLRLGLAGVAPGGPNGKRDGKGCPPVSWMHDGSGPAALLAAVNAAEN